MTKIFDSYLDFLQRADKEENGVSQAFANVNPEWEKQNETNEGCWNCSRCSDCSRCSRCSDCSRCSGCSDCSGCSGCSRCSGLENASPVEHEEKEGPLYPVIENIHQKIYEVVQRPDALNMGTWHTCDTTHCRAGWVVTLAGEEGKKLEARTSTLFAAMMIYGASSDINVSPTRFFECNSIAMADMERCANEEAEKATT